jgi:aminoglycoside 6'-N-acetyltransferase
VSDQGTVTQEAGLSIRHLRDDAHDPVLMLRWLAAPHVAEWWNPEHVALDLASVKGDFPSETLPEDPTTNCIIELGGRPIGFVQFHPWDAYADEMREMDFELPPGYWGLDIFIGELDQIDRGIGTRTVSLLRRYLLEERGATGVALVVARDNLRAQRAYEKAGLIRKREVLDVDTRDGKRIPSYLMATP